MATVTRRWYIYNGTPGGQHNKQNYFLTCYPYDLPNACGTPANNICAVLGIFQETTPFGPTITYGTNPKTFAADLALDNYITLAFASNYHYPPPSFKPYVYVRTI